MANEIRVRANLVSGTLSGSLTNVATSMSSAGLANLPVIGSTQHAVITIENEIVYVTAHTGGATTATILRAQDNTSAAAHNSGVAWVHGPVASDYVGVLGRTQVTANQGSIVAEVDLTSLSVTVTVPYAGHCIKITGHADFLNDTINGAASFFLQQDGTQIQRFFTTPSPVVNQPMGAHLVAVVTPTAASHTYKLRAARSNTGTVTMEAGATFPAFILVEDLGPAA